MKVRLSEEGQVWIEARVPIGGDQRILTYPQGGQTVLLLLVEDPRGLADQLAEALARA